MTSAQKVHALIDQLAARLPEQLAAVQQQASGMAAIALGAAAPFLPNLIPAAIEHAHDAVPDDPAAVDALLDAAAAHILSLKSDQPADIDGTATDVAPVAYEGIPGVADEGRRMHAGPGGSGELIGVDPDRPPAA